MSENNSSAVVEKKDVVVPVASVADVIPSEDAEFENELKKLEGTEKPLKQGKTELEKAMFTATSVLKRVKDLGGDPTKIVAEIVPASVVENPPLVDTSEFVTKRDLADQEAQRLAKTPGELKLMRYWMDKGMSASDAHHMANKGRISKLISEVSRSQGAIPSIGGGSGERGPEKTEVPQLSASEQTKLIQAGMKWVPEKKAWIGKKVQQRYDEVSKTWVTERI